MKELIEYYAKDVFGNRRCYVANSEQAKAIELLTRTKTLDIGHFAGLELLGFKFKQVLPPS
jgi:hypothetical protein